MRLNSMVLAAALLAALMGCNDRNDDPDGGTDPMDSGPDMCDGMETNVACCSDGVDNDGDGHIDCNDFACCGMVTCGPSTSCGMTRDGGPPPGDACDGPSAPEDTATACSDGCSNDHDMDLFVDCNDFDCCDARSDCADDTVCGMRMTGERCAGDPEPENTLPRCTDGCSNDDDTFVDCAEGDCCWILSEAASRGEATACGAGTFCADVWTPPSTSLCADDDLSGPPARENSYERCSDDCSNDRDGFADCDDFKCCAIIERAVAEGVAGAEACAAASPCATSWTPRAGVELCAGDDGAGDPPAEETVELCSNDCDDDRDGFEDCNDFDCCEARTDCPAGTGCGDM